MVAAGFLWLHAFCGGDPALLRLLHWAPTLRWGLGSYCADAGHFFDRQLGAVQLGLLAGWGWSGNGDLFPVIFLIISSHFFM